MSLWLAQDIEHAFLTPGQIGSPVVQGFGLEIFVQQGHFASARLVGPFAYMWTPQRTFQARLD